MKKFLAILLIALFAFQAIHCQEAEEENGLTGEEEIEIGEEEILEEELGENEQEILDLGNSNDWEPVDVEEFLADEDTFQVFLFGTQFFVADWKGNGQINETWVMKELHNVEHVSFSEGVDDYRLNLTLEKEKDASVTLLVQLSLTTSTSKSGKPEYRLSSYTTYQPDVYQLQDGSIVDALKKTTFSTFTYVLWGYRVQYVDFNFDPLPFSNPDTIVNWAQYSPEKFESNKTLVDSWGQDASKAAISKALKENIIEAGDWSLDYISDTSVFKMLANTYYRFGFQLKDSTNNLKALGYAFGILTNGQQDFKFYTSGIFDIEEPKDLSGTA